MDKNKRWKEITVLFLISVAIFGIAEDSGSREQVFIEAQGQITDIEMWGKMADTDLQVDGNDGETEERETESERVSGQETGSENASGHETGDEDISEQKAESENAVISYEELQCICRSGKYGYIDEAGKTVIPFDYDDAGAFVEGLAYFCIGEDYGFMDESLTPVFYLDCDSVSSFQGGFAYISVDGKYGYIDQTGEIVIEPAYQDADYFKNGYAVVVRNGKRGVIDQTGKEIVEPKYEQIDTGGENFVVREEENYQILDRNGQRLLKNPCKEAVICNDTAVSFRDSEQGICGYALGEDVVYFEEDYSVDMSFIPQRKLIILSKNESCGIKDYQGNTVIPFEYQRIDYDEYQDTYFLTDMEGEEREIAADDFTGKVEGIKLKENGLSHNFKYNKLTPRVPEYLDYLEHGKFVVEKTMNGQEEVVYAGGYKENRTTRLYDLGELGSPALCFRGYGAYDSSCGGVFAIQGGEVVCLVSGYDGGGTAGGERPCIWYDGEEGKLLPGISRHYGGGVFGWSGKIYDSIEGVCREKVYLEAYDHARPEGGETKSNYYVDGERVTEEYYRELDKRYSMVAIP